MTRLGEAHIEQIKTMRGEGKTLKEIKEHFKETYKIKLYDAVIIKIAPKKLTGSVAPRAKHAYHKRGPKDVDEASLDRLIKDVQILLREIPAGYKKIIKHIRVELIKSRTEVCEILHGAGIDVPESPIK